LIIWLLQVVAVEAMRAVQARVAIAHLPALLAAVHLLKVRFL